jgi:hypothetical protein
MVDIMGCIMVFTTHDSKRATYDSGRRSQKASGCGSVDGRRTAFPGVYRKKEEPADFLLYPAGHQYGDSEVREVKPLESESMECVNTPSTLTSLPGLEEEMAKSILPALSQHFTHLYRRSGRNGGDLWV